jgi:hypothetical protein
VDKRGSRKRVGRPAGQRPMIAMRVDPDLYRDLEHSAARRKIPIAHDAANRLRQSFHWDQAFGEQKKLIADTRQAIAKNKEAALRDWGFQPVAGRDGLWVESVKIKPAEMLALNPALEIMIERIVILTLEKMKERQA